MRRAAVGLLLLLLVAGCGAEGKAPVPTPPVVDCGAEEQGHGGKVNQAGRNCLLQNFAAGTPAVFSTSRLTTEGDPIIWTIRVRSKERVDVDVDTTRDKFGERKVTHYTCRSLAPRVRANERHERLEVTGCKGGPNAELTF